MLNERERRYEIALCVGGGSLSGGSKRHRPITFQRGLASRAKSDAVRLPSSVLIGQSQNDPPKSDPLRFGGTSRTSKEAAPREKAHHSLSPAPSLASLSKLPNSPNNRPCLDVEKEARPAPRPRAARPAPGSSSQSAESTVFSAPATTPSEWAPAPPST